MWATSAIFENFLMPIIVQLTKNRAIWSPCFGRQNELMLLQQDSYPVNTLQTSGSYENNAGANPLTSEFLTTTPVLQ
jgi:hypothetical protein